MSRTTKQIAVIIAVACAFVLFDLGIYFCFTVRYKDNSDELMKAKQIELDKYLPFDENSQIARLDTDFSLSGELPQLDGATALFPVYSAIMNSTYPEGSCIFDGGEFSEDSLLQKRNTVGAYKALVDGEADIIFVAQPSAEQLEYAEASGVELTFVPIGKEAFVFITSSENHVKSLTVEQIKGIYSGKYSKWSEVGGEGVPINALQRVKNSGSQTAMVSFMGDTALKENTSNPFGKSIGYSFRYYVTDVVGKANVKILEVDGVYPNEQSIRDGSYPICSELYAVYRTDDTNENIVALVSWILSDEGQELINKTGYVGING